MDRRSTRPDAFRVWRQVAVAHAASERVEGHLLHLLTPERRRPAPAAMWQRVQVTQLAKRNGEGQRSLFGPGQGHHAFAVAADPLVDRRADLVAGERSRLVETDARVRPRGLHRRRNVLEQAKEIVGDAATLADENTFSPSP